MNLLYRVKQYARLGAITGCLVAGFAGGCIALAMGFPAVFTLAAFASLIPSVAGACAVAAFFGFFLGGAAGALYGGIPPQENAAASPPPAPARQKARAPAIAGKMDREPEVYVPPPPPPRGTRYFRDRVHESRRNHEAGHAGGAHKA